MKKILVTLVVLALCAPAMAATIDVVGGTDGTAVVTITADGAANIVGLGLDVDVDGGAQVTAVSVDTADFNIYPDAANTMELATPGSYTYGAGSPIAAKTAAGEIALPQSSFALSFANLNGSATAGADGAASVQVTITVDAACTLTVCENATRGGIVAVDGSSLEAACDSDAITVGPGECVKATAPWYSEWESVGKPDCWCYSHHCYGDADGALVPAGKTTPAYWVGSNDLGILANAWQVESSLMTGDMICADFDRTEVPAGKTTPAYRVGSGDLGILAGSWQVDEASTPACDDTDFNFWTN